MRSKKIFITSYFIMLLVLVSAHYFVNKNYQDILIKVNKITHNDNYNNKIINLETTKEKLINEFSSIIPKQELSMDNIIKYENTINKENDDLQIINAELTEASKALNTQVTTLKTHYNKLVKKYTYKIPNVKTINQYSKGYPTGCESAALTILLNYHKVNVSMDDVVKRIKKGPKPYYENGKLYGANPYIEFVGTPSDPGSYGTYEQAIIEVANYYKPGIINATGQSLNEILEIVSEGRPVIVWNSMNLSVPYVSRSWIHKASGKKIKWIANEHALVVIGFNQNQVIVSDSLNGGIKYFNRVTFENRYKAYGKRALYY